MFLISTTLGTARFMTQDEMYLEDLNLGIYMTFRLLNNKQIDDIFMYAETEITDSQEQAIRELAGA